VLTADVVLPAAALLFTELLLMGWVETKRWQDFRNPGSQGDGSFLGITDGFKGKGNGYPGVCQYKLDCTVESGGASDAACLVRKVSFGPAPCSLHRHG